MIGSLNAEEALHSVANKFLGDLKLSENAKENEGMINALTDMCVFVHESVTDAASHFFEQLRRHVYITPKSYIDCIDNIYTDA